MGRGHSRSLEIAPFNRSHTNSQCRSTVTMALSYIISETSLKHALETSVVLYVAQILTGNNTGNVYTLIWLG